MGITTINHIFLMVYTSLYMFIPPIYGDWGDCLSLIYQHWIRWMGIGDHPKTHQWTISETVRSNMEHIWRNRNIMKNPSYYCTIFFKTSWISINIISISYQYPISWGFFVSGGISQAPIQKTQGLSPGAMQPFEVDRGLLYIWRFWVGKSPT